MAFLFDVTPDTKGFVFTIRAGTKPLHVDVKTLIQVGDSVESVARAITSCGARAEEKLRDELQDHMENLPAKAE